jgi:hypothetical protein
MLEHYRRREIARVDLKLMATLTGQRNIYVTHSKVLMISIYLNFD